jgi:hypothetical protein
LFNGSYFHCAFARTSQGKCLVICEIIQNAPVAAAIAHLTERHEMIVAARDKKLEAVRENRKLKRPTTTRLYSLISRQTRSFTLNQGNSNLKCLKLHVGFCT